MQYKFRGLRADGKGWVYGHYTQGTPEHHYITNPDGSVWEVIPSTVGMWTGLKDIYQGDYVADSEQSFEVCFGTYWIEKESIDSIGFYLKNIHNGFLWPLGEIDSAVLEVTGNIHEPKQQ